MDAIPLAPGFFTTGAQPVLFGGRNRETGRIAFPCPDGSEGELYEKIPLTRSGTLWSWTIQRFRPKSPPYTGPEAFEPFALGYVELAGEVIVQGRLTGIPFDQLRLGMKLTLTTVPFNVTADGTPTVIYAFRPAGEQPA